MKFKLTKLTAALATAALLSLAGCGGGGSSTPAPLTLSGTVAGGTAVVGTVLVTDSKGATNSTTIGSNGQYTIDIGTMTGPFVLKATGTVGTTTVTYYSAATAADLGGTVNVTPFTDLIVSNIAAQLAVNYFSNPDNVANIGTLITPAKLAAAETAMQAKLQPVLTAMGLGTSVDLLHQTFTANHAGLDAVLDLVKVAPDTATNKATLVNALTQLAIGTNDATATTLDPTPIDSAKIVGIGATTGSDYQAITAKLDAFAALFATGLPSAAAIQTSGVFDTSSNFLHEGSTFAQFADMLANAQYVDGWKFSNIAIALEAGGNSGTLTGTYSSNSGWGYPFQSRIVKDASKGWLLQGDGRIASFELTAQAEFSYYSATSRHITSNGIFFYFYPDSYNSNHASTPIVSALITGPGLPSGGIEMLQNADQTIYDCSNFGTAVPVGSAAPSAPSCVNVALAVDNSVYTVVLKDGSGNSLNGAGYQLTLPKQPYSTSALSAANFPTFDSITVGGQPITLSALGANTNIAVSWTTPPGLAPKNLGFYARGTSGASFTVWNELASSATQTVVAMGTPFASGRATSTGFILQAWDGYGRRFITNKYYLP